MTVSSDQPMEVHAREITPVRTVIVGCLVVLLVYCCLQSDHGGHKGTPLEAWRLIPLILAATTLSMLGKRYLNPITGMLLGGVGGAFGTLDYFAAPYGIVVGLVVGAIVITLPVADKPPLQRKPEALESNQNQNISHYP